MRQKNTLSSQALKIFESVPDLYLILSPELYILTASDAYLATTLSKRHEIAGKYVFDAFPDNPNIPQAKSENSLHASLQHVLKSHRPHRLSLQRYDVPQTASGGFEEKYWTVTNTPVLDEHSNIFYIIHKVEDVSEQVKAQRQVQELTSREEAALLEIDWEKKKLHSIFMQAPVGIAIFGSEEHIIELINPRMSELLGHPAEELVGRPLFDALPEVRGLGFEAIMSEVYTTGKTFEATEIPGTALREGEPVQGFYNLTYQPLRNSHQQITGIIQISVEITEQVIGKKDIEQKERQLRLITDSLPVLISYLDREEKYRFANKAYEEWFPLKAEDLLGRTVQEVVGEKAYSGVKGYIERALQGERQEFSAKMPYREGFIKYINTTYVPDIQEGEVRGFYALVKDVTSQAEARQQLQESEEKYRSLFETMDQGFCILEIIFDAANKPVDYRFIEVNPTFEQQTGLKGAKGKTALELIPDLETHWLEVYGGVALTGESAQLTLGSEAMGRWFEINAFRIGGSESRKVALLFSNVTNRKQVEESLQRSNLWFRRVNQATQDTIWDWNLESQEVHWNEGVQRMFSYRPEEVSYDAKWWYEHIHPEDRERVVKGIHEVIDSGKEHWSGEYRFLTGNGGYKIVFDRGFVIHDENGKPSRMIGSMQDISERKKAEEDLKAKNLQLTRINNDLDNFIYTASHDLKAPILNIEGLVGLLRKALPSESRDSDKVKTILEMINNSIGRFKETIKDLAEVAKVGASAEEEVDQINFEAILEEVTLNIRSLVNDSDALILADFSQVPTIYFSKKNLRSILYNLLSNAIKYRSPHRPLEISIKTARQEDGYIVLSVEDNGLGIKEKDKEKVFVMFKRLHQHVEGTGIGMAIVKKIMDNSGGKIALESEKGKGSVFRIFFKDKKN